jgi:hypothetical protein
MTIIARRRFTVTGADLRAEIARRRAQEAEALALPLELANLHAQTVAFLGGSPSHADLTVFTAGLAAQLHVLSGRASVAAECAK